MYWLVCCLLLREAGVGGGTCGAGKPSGRGAVFDKGAAVAAFLGHLDHACLSPPPPPPPLVRRPPSCESSLRSATGARTACRPWCLSLGGGGRRGRFRGSCGPWAWSAASSRRRRWEGGWAACLGGSVGWVARGDGVATCVLGANDVGGVRFASLACQAGG
jgi:hypothetical protein